MNQPLHPTIGFLTANVHVGAARSLWRGVLDAAQAGNANLICFPGGRMHSTEAYEAERNVMYDLADAQCLDGIVSWTSALAGTLTPGDIVEFHRRFHPIPVVSLAQPLGDSPLVSINSYHGMRALIFHLVDVHNYRRLALIRGPEGHPYELERYHAYLDALTEKGLSPDPTLITPAMAWEKGAEAMRVLLDERCLTPGVDFEAVVAVSDLLAIDALRMMAERGIRVPTDVAVVGFNDIEEGRLVRPPLTSVSLPFYDQGRRSVELLLTMLADATVPPHTLLDSRLLIRQSCGCPSQPVDLAAVEFSSGDSQSAHMALPRAQEQLVEQIARVIQNRGVAATWAKQLLDSFFQEITAESRGQFRSTLDGMLQQGVLDGDETAAWQSAISVLRREMVPALDVERRLHAENLFGQARVVIGEAIQRAQSARQLQDERQSQSLRDIGQALITAYDVDALGEVLVERLPELGIDTCYLALYENPAVSVDWSNLMFAYREGQRVELSPANFRFPSRQLVPPSLLPTRRYSLLVEPLYFKTEPIGFVVFEIGPRDGAVYEVLRGHISSALQAALLFRDANEARRTAERADQIKTRLLANVSHELRTPLNIIIGHTQRILAAPPPDLAKDLEHVLHSAEHQLRIINDLLDLSRAEINSLDLYPVLLEPKTLIEEAFSALAENTRRSSKVTWQLDLPDTLPVILADPVRLRQILLNLLSNAAKFTEQGQISLGADLAAPHLHIWVADTGAGIPAEMQERIYEPFFTHERIDQQPSGIGLGLSITRHLVALHHGYLELDSEPGQGSTFHIYLPVPGLTDQTPVAQAAGSTLWLISSAQAVPGELLEFSSSRNLVMRQVSIQDDLDSLLSEDAPVVIAWDLASMIPEDWQVIRRLHNHPKLSQVPFVLYGNEAGGDANGLTSLVVKPATSQALWEAIRHTLPVETHGSVVIVDDDAQARALAHEAVARGLPGYTIRLAEGGEAGLAAILGERPSLVILDLMMPDMDGFEVLDHMRSDERTQHVPVVILSGRQLSLTDVKRLEQHAAVTLHSKDIVSEDELIAALQNAAFGSQPLPVQTSALVKRAIVFLQRNFARPLTRREVAGGIGVSEDYLTRIFNLELGISPWDYLNRYRIARAKKLLRDTEDAVEYVSSRVGFSDPAYFSRVFRRIAGVSPRAYREHPVDPKS